MSADKEDNRYLGDLAPYASVYNELIAERKAAGTPMALGKHTAANVNYCKAVIKTLQEAGHNTTADWAIWMLWWRMQDRTLAQQIDDMRVQEIQSLRKRIDELEREKRGIGPEDQYSC